MTVGTRQSAAIVMSWVARVTGYASARPLGGVSFRRRCFTGRRSYEWVSAGGRTKRTTTDDRRILLLHSAHLLTLSRVLLMRNRISSLFDVVIESEHHSSFMHAATSPRSTLRTFLPSFFLYDSFARCTSIDVLSFYTTSLHNTVELPEVQSTRDTRILSS